MVWGILCHEKEQGKAAVTIGEIGESGTMPRKRVTGLASIKKNHGVGGLRHNE